MPSLENAKPLKTNVLLTGNRDEECRANCRFYDSVNHTYGICKISDLMKVGGECNNPMNCEVLKEYKEQRVRRGYNGERKSM